MILKIVADFSNLPKIMEELTPYNLMFYNNTLYVSDVKSNFSKKVKSIIKKHVGPDCYIADITPENYQNELPKVQEWCNKQMVWANLIAYEKENQKKLRDAMNALDHFEQIIFNETGGDADG